MHRDTGGLPLLLTTVTEADGGEGDLHLIVSAMLARLSRAERDVVETVASSGPWRT